MSKESENKMVKFSVIIPTYNSEDTITRALDSVRAQSYTDYEVIVIDDASADRTVEIIEKYPLTITLIKKVVNSGSSVARNAGMDIATGAYIAFLDADDAWHKDKLMLMDTILSSKPGIWFVYHPYTQENILDKRLPENITMYKFPFVKLLQTNPIGTPCVVIRNDPSFRFEPTMRYSEDYDLWLRIGYKHKIYFINIPLTQLYRPIRSAGGVSARKWKMRRGEMRAYRRLVRLNLLFLPLIPMLLLSSLGKHILKKFSK